MWSMACFFALAACAAAAPPAEPEKLLAPERTPRAEAYPHLHNLLRLTPRIYSGGEPHGEESFAELQKLGVKTVVSVDGARPEVELAKKYGLRYVHIPIGYDGVDETAANSLARVMREVEGPIYFHCHHGKHRGPAAAALACVASGAVDGKGALEVLRRAGTSKDYAGLWRDVEKFTPPAADAKLPPLVETAKVGDMAAAMAQIDRAKDNLALAQQAQWATPKDHPDIVPLQEAVILREALHESGRNLAGDYDDAFRTLLAESEALAASLEAALKAKQHDTASGQMEKLLKSCKECHGKYRD
jgi:protein tyrosine phosphatase (PTP) superfamily phosphohydrolase (DUF442 family)